MFIDMFTLLFVSEFAMSFSLSREETRRFCNFLHNLHWCVQDKKYGRVSNF